MASSSLACCRLVCFVAVTALHRGVIHVQAYQAQNLELGASVSPDFYIGSVRAQLPQYPGIAFRNKRLQLSNQTHVSARQLGRLPPLGGVTDPAALPSEEQVRVIADRAVAAAQKELPDVWANDMFPAPSAVPKSDEEIIATSEMLVFLGLTAIFSVLHRFLVTMWEPTLRTHVLTLLLWFVCAIIYNGLIWVRHGSDNGSLWTAGYVLEWMLSVDNLFVFHMVFKHFKTPPEELDKALFLGIAGAVLLRVVFFFVSYSLLDYLNVARYLFGALLIYSGVHGACVDEEEEGDLSESYTLQSLVSLLGGRLSLKYTDSRLFIWDSGKLQVTMLLPVVFMLEFTDLLFAVDSVAAKIGLISDRYIAYTSTVLAMFGLRAMFFVVQYLVECFELLKYGIAFILVFIGAELVLHDFIDLSPMAALGVICSAMLVSVVASVVKTRCEEAEKALTRGSAVEGAHAGA